MSRPPPTSPLSPHTPLSRSASTSPATSTAETARNILTRGGWTFDQVAGVWKKKKLELSFTLATADEPELVATDSDRKSTRLNSSHQIISYAVFCLKKKNKD